MAVEIERKFLVRSEDWRREVVLTRRLAQGYLANTALSSVRIRLADGQGTLSVKAMTPGLAREEFEYGVPAAEARYMLDRLCEGPRVEKQRHYVDVEGYRFEVDEFGLDNAGLVIAELELSDAAETGPRPAWLGDEVTSRPRYYSFQLAVHPFRDWPAADRAAVRAGRHFETLGEGGA